MTSFPLVQCSPEEVCSDVSNKHNALKKILVVIVFIFIALCIAILTVTGLAIPTKRNDIEDNYKMNITAVIIENMNTSINPCDDFYEFACGGFRRHNPIPQDSGSYSRSKMVFAKILNDMKNIITHVTFNDEAPYSSAQKLAMFYDTCMKLDSNRSRNGTAMLDVVRSVSGSTTWPKVMWSKRSTEEILVAIRKLFGKQMIVSFTDQLVKIASTQLLVGLGRYSAAFYGNNRFYNVQDSYKRSMFDVANLLAADRINGDIINIATTKKLIHEIFELETEIAKINGPEYKRYKHKSRDVPLAKLISVRNNTTRDRNLFWKVILEDKPLDDIMVRLDVINILRILEKYDRRTVENYLTWRVIQLKLPYFTRYNDVHDDIMKSVSGASETRTRTDICLVAAMRYKSVTKHGRSTSCYGLYFGDLFISNHLSRMTKSEVRILISEIVKTFDNILASSQWLDTRTENATRHYLKKMRFILGDTGDELFKAMRDDCSNVRLPTIDDIIDTIDEQYYSNFDKPHHTYSGMASLAEVNAMYSVQAHLVILTAGILQEPLYHPRYHPALRYGAMGSIIGHEIVHAFQPDYLSAHTDISHKMMKDIRNKTACMRKQFSQFCYPSLNMCVNGSQTQNENVPDNSGVHISFAAFQSHLKTSGRTKRFPGLEQYSNEQMFFISYASFFCENPSTFSRQLQMLENEHSPRKNRVNGVALNMREFSTTFQCSADDNMNLSPAERCRVW